MKPNIILTLLSVVLFPFSASADFHIDSIRQAIVDNDCYVDSIRQRLFPPVEIKQHGSSLYTEEINSPVLGRPNRFKVIISYLGETRNGQTNIER